jgi:hypothetical protein
MMVSGRVSKWMDGWMDGFGQRKLFGVALVRAGLDSCYCSVLLAEHCIPKIPIVLNSLYPLDLVRGRGSGVLVDGFARNLRMTVIYP